MEIIKETCYKGTRILLGNEKQEYLQKCREYLKAEGFTEIQIPIIQHAEIFAGKVGEENNNMMYNLTDRGGRDLCLTPEITAVVQKLASTYFKNKKDVKLFYVAECFRGEKPQKLRFRQFTQLGVEVLNPTKDWTKKLVDTASNLINYNDEEYFIILNNKRGLDYYEEFTFEIENIKNKLSVVGGGSYKNGIGFAIGVDRLMEISVKNK
jgi:histidyl-tRNA synthetase